MKGRGDDEEDEDEDEDEREEADEEEQEKVASGCCFGAVPAVAAEAAGALVESVVVTDGEEDVEDMVCGCSLASKVFPCVRFLERESC
jgi:hypothetical protein